MARDNTLLYLGGAAVIAGGAWYFTRPTAPTVLDQLAAAGKTPIQIQAASQNTAQRLGINLDSVVNALSKVPAIFGGTT